MRRLTHFLTEGLVSSLQTPCNLNDRTVSDYLCYLDLLLTVCFPPKPLLVAPFWRIILVYQTLPFMLLRLPGLIGFS